MSNDSDTNRGGAFREWIGLVLTCIIAASGFAKWVINESVEKYADKQALINKQFEKSISLNNETIKEVERKQALETIMINKKIDNSINKIVDSIDDLKRIMTKIQIDNASRGDK